MKLIHHPILACFLLAASCGVSQADVLYSFAGPQLVSDTWNFAPPGLSLSRGATATGRLYFKYTVTNPASNKDTESYYAGMSFFDGGNEHLGVGNGWYPWAYSAFAPGDWNLDLKSATPEPGQPYQLVRSTDMTTIVIRVDFNSGANDNITVWLNPNLALSEAAQNPALTTTFTANADFDTIYLREGGGGGGWTYSDFAIAENATDAGFFAVPLTTSTWDGGGSDSNWSTAANWLGDTAPAAGFDLIFPFSTNTLPANDLAAGTDFTGLKFDGGATSYTLTGNAIGISNFVRNTSLNPQTIEMPLELNGPLTFEALNSSLSIDGPVSGPHGITKNGGNRLELRANNSYTGNTAITTGTLSIGDGDVTGSIDPTGTVSFGAGTTTRLEINRSDNTTLANAITTGGRANVAATGGQTVTLSGPITGTGEFWTHGPGTFKITPNAGSASFATSVVVATGTLEVSDFTTNTLGTGGFFIGQAGSGTLRYTGPTTSTDRVGAYALQGVGTNTFIEVTTPSTELTFTQPLDDNDPGGKGLTKTGPGALILAAAPVYTGNTIVEAGVLSLTQPGFADTSTVTVTDDGQLRLDFDGSDTVTGIVLGPNTMGPGTYSSTTHPDYISGTGSLVIPATDPYPAWIAGFTFEPGADLTKSGDADADGLTNFEEFAFGLAPNSGSSVNPIAVPLDKTNGTFSYTRRLPSLSGLTCSVWYSTDLAGWTEDTGAVEGIPVVNGEVEIVPVSLSVPLLANPKLFIQVRAE
ncbi:MAG: autotransporter-associated beta strand repeat-containing protein [Verrucomicrobia bacterium]|nr:autotransporter-associated beta strand repeat-containing protein [Verrucomicrobiota bacterium]